MTQTSHIDLALQAVTGHWRSGRQIRSVVDTNSVTGLMIGVKAKALRMGLRWLWLDTNKESLGKGSHHRFWCVLKAGEAVPWHPAMDGGAEAQEEDWRMFIPMLRFFRKPKAGKPVSAGGPLLAAGGEVDGIFKRHDSTCMCAACREGRVTQEGRRPTGEVGSRHTRLKPVSAGGALRRQETKREGQLF